MEAEVKLEVNPATAISNLVPEVGLAPAKRALLSKRETELRLMRSSEVFLLPCQHLARPIQEPTLLVDLEVGELLIDAHCRLSVTLEDESLRQNALLLPRLSQHFVQFLFVKAAKLGNFSEELEHFRFFVDVASRVLHFQNLDKLQEVFLFKVVPRGEDHEEDVQKLSFDLQRLYVPWQVRLARFFKRHFARLNRREKPVVDRLLFGICGCPEHLALPKLELDGVLVHVVLRGFLLFARDALGRK